MKRESAIEGGEKRGEDELHFAAFKEEVRRLKTIESERLRDVTEGKGLRTVHFQSVNQEELTAEDWRMYEKVMHYADYGEGLVPEFDAYQQAVQKSGILSRKAFARGFLANRLAALHGQALVLAMREAQEKKG